MGSSYKYTEQEVPDGRQNKQKKKTPWPLVRKRTIPTEGWKNSSYIKKLL
jgi:hypothetical protein